MVAHPTLVPPPAVLAAFELAADSLVRATSGLINPTWYARSTHGTPVVLQRVNPIFPAVVNLDIAAVTEHLARKGLLTPRLVPSRDGAPPGSSMTVPWRVLTRIDGVCRDALESPAQAREAGRVLAEFHRAVSDLDHTFRNARLGVHDTARHLRGLRDALAEHRDHRDIGTIEPLAERVLALAAACQRCSRARSHARRTENLEPILRTTATALPHRSRHARAHARRARARRRAALVVQPGHRGRR
jgi:hypothetical protein